MPKNNNYVYFYELETEPQNKDLPITGFLSAASISSLIASGILFANAAPIAIPTGLLIAGILSMGGSCAFAYSYWRKHYNQEKQFYTLYPDIESGLAIALGQENLATKKVTNLLLEHFVDEVSATLEKNADFVQTTKDNPVTNLTYHLCNGLIKAYNAQKTSTTKNNLSSRDFMVILEMNKSNFVKEFISKCKEETLDAKGISTLCQQVALDIVQKTALPLTQNPQEFIRSLGQTKSRQQETETEVEIIPNTDTVLGTVTNISQSSFRSSFETTSSSHSSRTHSRKSSSSSLEV